MTDRLDDLFRELSELVHRRKAGWIDAQGRARIMEIEAEIDRLEAIEMGPDFARMEALTERMEAAAKAVQALVDAVDDDPLRVNIPDGPGQ